METPNNRAGKLTDLIMSRIRTTLVGRKLPELESPRQHNAVYECVYEVLFRELVLGAAAKASEEEP